MRFFLQILTNLCLFLSKLVASFSPTRRLCVTLICSHGRETYFSWVSGSILSFYKTVQCTSYSYAKKTKKDINFDSERDIVVKLKLNPSNIQLNWKNNKMTIILEVTDARWRSAITLGSPKLWARCVIMGQGKSLCTLFRHA